MNFQRGKEKEPLEINLVPMIDVMLVILIFLMITTTYSRYTELQINLPAADAEKQLERSNEIAVLVNAQGRSVERIGNEAAKLQRREPQAGNDLYLTIDLRVQQTAEEALRGQRAAAVAIDPTNGDVIALVSTPAFDPNLFARGLSRKDYLALTEDPNRPMYDRALRGVYPPGSTVKPLFAMAALDTGVVTPLETRYCRGRWSAGGETRTPARFDAARLLPI